MSFLQFYNADWSRLSSATAIKEGCWGLPDEVPLALLLDLTPEQIGRICDLSVYRLRLSASRYQSLLNRGTTTIAQLLGYTISTLLRLPNMGHGSVMVILGELLRLAHAVDIPELDLPSDMPEPVTKDTTPAGPPTRPAASFVSASLDDLQPLTLTHEWELFSGLPTCGASLPLAQLALSDETLYCLRELGVFCLHDLLAQNVASLSERIGEEAFEEVLDALTTYAADARLLPNPSALLDPVTESAEAILTERWGHRPVSELKLANEAVRVLRRINATTVSELLNVLDPLHIELALDPFAFSVIWMRLQAIGLRQEAWEDAGERLSAEAYTRASLDHVINSWGSTMPALRWRIVSERLGLEKDLLDKREDNSLLTLEEVANRNGVTRERVRQIEVKFIERLTKKHDDHFIALQNTLKMILFNVGGVISLDQAAKELAEWINPGDAVPEGLCRLILNNSPSFVTIKKNALYTLTSKQPHFYQTIINAAREIMITTYRDWSISDLAGAVSEQILKSTGSSIAKNKLPSREFVASCLMATGGFEKKAFAPPEVALVRLLREMGGPQHFTELADRLNEKGWRERPTSAKCVHNHLLSRRDLFVYISAGTYGLIEWGMEDRRVERGGESIGDLIVEFLLRHGVPASKEEITTFVLSRKNCRGTSVVQKLLYDELFHCFDQNKYGLSQWTF